MSHYDYHWDEEKCGFFVTVDGVLGEFFPAKSKWDRGAANDAAKKMANRLRSEEILKLRKKQEAEYQLKPLSQLEAEWIGLHKKLIAAANKLVEMTEKELQRYKQITEVVRHTVLDGTHPAMQEPLNCPCCGGKAYHTVGDKSVRSVDIVNCVECELTMETEYEPYSALIKWNKRVK